MWYPGVDRQVQIEVDGVTMCIDFFQPDDLSDDEFMEKITNYILNNISIEVL